MRKSNKGETSPGSKIQSSSNTYHGREGRHGGHDQRRIKCFNCGIYEHYVAECQRPKKGKDKEQWPEVNLTHVQDDEHALLLGKR